MHDGGDRIGWFGRAWVAAIFGYSVLRAVVVWPTLGRYGVNPWMFLFIDVVTAWPYAVGQVRVVQGLRRRNWQGRDLGLGDARCIPCAIRVHRRRRDRRDANSRLRDYRHACSSDRHRSSSSHSASGALTGDEHLAQAVTVDRAICRALCTSDGQSEPALVRQPRPGRSRRRGRSWSKSHRSGSWPPRAGRRARDAASGDE